MNNQSIEELNNRNLDNCFFCLYCIPFDIFINDGNSYINKKTIIVIYSCNLKGQRRFVSSVLLDDLKDANDWYNLFMSFKSRGLCSILFAVLPDISPLKRAIKIAFNEVIIFNAYFDAINKISNYFTLKYSSNIFSFIRKIFISENIEQFNMLLSDFKNNFKDSPFIIDLLEKDINNAKKNYKYNFHLRKHIFSFYFIRELSKKLVVISHSKPYFSSCNEFISDCIDIIKLTEKKVYCPKAEWISVINEIYAFEKDLIKCYL